MASVTLDSNSNTPQSTRPGAVRAWKSIACDMMGVACATMALADKTHNRPHTAPRVAVILWSMAFSSSPPEAFACCASSSTFCFGPQTTLFPVGETTQCVQGRGGVHWERTWRFEQNVLMMQSTVNHPRAGVHVNASFEQQMWQAYSAGRGQIKAELGRKKV